MNELVNRVISSVSGRYFALQVLAIFVIWLVGMILCTALKSRRRYTLAFPMGLSVFAIEGFAILTIGLPYNAPVVLIVYLFTAIIPLLILYRTGELGKEIQKIGIKRLLLALAVVVIIAAFACSGLIPLSLSNDSMYYFHEYPRDIVYYKGLRDQFDVFMTDTGLGSVIIDSIPHLFGFNETFGIREFMHMSFIAYFANLVYDYAMARMNRTAAKVTTVLAMLILATSTPVFILGHWAMANMYLMELFFIGAAEAAYCSNFTLVAVPTVACALMRIEGPMYVLYLVLAISLLNHKSSDLVFKILLPIAALEGGYLFKIFSEYVIDNPYTFMTPQKALIEIAAILAVAIYMLLIRERLPELISANLPGLFIAALVGGNLLLLLRNSELYMANLRAFSANLTRQSGWGMLPYLTASAVAILLVVNVFLKRIPTDKGVSDTLFFIVLTIGFALVAIALSWARGDALDEQVGDSGNRVLLQIAPLVIYTLTMCFANLTDGKTDIASDDAAKE